MAKTTHETLDQDLLETVALDADPDPARDLIFEGIEAFRLTREYLGPEFLPEIEGWSWFDWVQKAEDYLYG